MDSSCAMDSNNNQQCSGANRKNAEAVYWNKDSTLYLLAVLRNLNYFGDKESGKTKKELHVQIAKLLNEAGFTFTAEQCCGRIKTLLDAYRKVKDHNRQSGSETKTCKYYDDLEDLLGHRPTANPVAPCSSRNPTDHDYVKSSIAEELPGRYNISDSDSTDESTAPKKLKTDRNTTVTKPKIKLRREKSTKTKLLDFLQDYEKREAEREAARLVESRRQHDETKELLQSLVYAINKKTDN